jgi:hypothetical protein
LLWSWRLLRLPVLRLLRLSVLRRLRRPVLRLLRRPVLRRLRWSRRLLTTGVHWVPGWRHVVWRGGLRCAGIVPRWLAKAVPEVTCAERERAERKHRRQHRCDRARAQRLHEQQADKNVAGRLPHRPPLRPLIRLHVLRVGRGVRLAIGRTGLRVRHRAIVEDRFDGLDGTEQRLLDERRLSDA